MLLTEVSETGVGTLSFDRVALPDDGRREPKPAAARTVAGEIAATTRLDPQRIAAGPGPAPARRRSPWGAFGSLLLHLLPLLLLADWPRTPPAVETPIPVRLVIEQPPAPPEPAPAEAAEAKPSAKPPPAPAAMRRGSADMAEVEGPDVETGGGNPTPHEDKPRAPPPAASSPAETPRVPETEPETKTVLVAPPLPPPPPIPLDLPAVDAAPQLPEPRPAPAAPSKAPPQRRDTIPIVTLRDSAWPLPLHNGPPRRALRTARLVGPAAVRDAYCAEALAMTLKHIGLLPRALTGARNGETQLSIRVLGDGTIAGVRVARSSGYPDIDERVERMVVAVGHFPPLPRWMGASMDFTFNLHFPHPLQR